MLQRRVGVIVHIASLVSKEGIPLFAHYSAAKASLIGLMHSMARELAPNDISMNALPAMLEEGGWTSEDAWAEVTHR